MATPDEIGSETRINYISNTPRSQWAIDPVTAAAAANADSEDSIA